MEDEETYDGVLLHELPIEEVIWTQERAEHIRTRSARKGPKEIDVEPKWAEEAIFEPNRFVRRGTGSESIEILGYSATMGRVLMVWLWSYEHPPNGLWYGASAVAVSGKTARAYEERWQ